MAWPKCGHNGLIYVSGTHIDGANSWNITVDTESVELRKFGDDWVARCATFNSASGSIEAIDNVKDLMDAAKARASVSFLIYPDAGTTGEYWSGNAIFGAGGDGSVDGPAGASSSFVSDGEVSWTGS